MIYLVVIIGFLAGCFAGFVICIWCYENMEENEKEWRKRPRKAIA